MNFSLRNIRNTAIAASLLISGGGAVWACTPKRVDSSRVGSMIVETWCCCDGGVGECAAYGCLEGEAVAHGVLLYIVPDPCNR